MSNKLTFENIINLRELYHHQQFSGLCPFDLLGEGLSRFIEGYLLSLGVIDSPIVKGKVHNSAYLQGPVYIDEGAEVEPTAYITGPAYIGPGSEIRHGSYIRGSVFVGSRCVVGHATEAKGAVFFDGAKAGHFAYVGDSILGRNVNLGAGTKIANLKLDRSIVKYKCPDSGHRVGSGLKKFGAILGDDSQTGCNAVLSPGTILMARAIVMPCAHYHGTLKGTAGK